MSIRIIGNPIYEYAERYDSLNIGDDESGWSHPNNVNNDIYSSSWDGDVLTVHIKKDRYFPSSSQAYIRIGSCDSEDVKVYNDTDYAVRCKVDDIQSGSSDVTISAHEYHSFNTDGNRWDVYLYFYIVTAHSAAAEIV